MSKAAPNPLLNTANRVLIKGNWLCQKVNVLNVASHYGKVLA